VPGAHRRGQQFKPSLVRVGLKVHHSVATVALDTLVGQRLAASATVRAGGEHAAPAAVTAVAGEGIQLHRFVFMFSSNRPSHPPLPILARACTRRRTLHPRRNSSVSSERLATSAAGRHRPGRPHDRQPR